MKDDLNINPLHPYLRTKKDATDMILLIEKLTGELFNQNYTVDKIISEQLPYELASILSDMARNYGIDINDKNSFQKLLNLIAEKIPSIPVMHLILAIEPTVEIINKVSTWFFDKYKTLVILDITIDNDIIGGAILSFNGRANEYSLRNQIIQLREN